MLLFRTISPTILQTLNNCKRSSLGSLACQQALHLWKSREEDLASRLEEAILGVLYAHHGM